MINLRGTWDDPRIKDDSRIDDQSVDVRYAAERLHNNESMHAHDDILGVTCVYCALRATRVLKCAGLIDIGTRF